LILTLKVRKLDEVDEEEIAPIDESVSTLLFDQNLSEDWFYTVEEDQDHAVEEEDQDPVAEEQEPVEEEQEPGGRGLVNFFHYATEG
jgi:hypothetical protein